MEQKVKLITGIITSFCDDSDVQKILEQKYGKIDFKSEMIPFDFTDYYSSEMGKSLKRYWLSFEELIFPDQLADIKTETNLLEKKFSENGRRKVNIDPGYLALSKLVLASTKDFSHRIYLKDKIYAEITMIYAQNQFNFLPWTYSDYKSGTFLAFAKQVRAKLLSQLRQEKLTY